MEHFDLVEKLVKTFGVSYEQAKKALEAANWDAVEAAILIEKEKQSAEPEESTGSAFNVDSFKEQWNKGVKTARKGTAAFFKKAADFIDDANDDAANDNAANGEQAQGEAAEQSEQPKQSVGESEAYQDAKRRCNAAKQKTCGFFSEAAAFFDKNHFVVAKPTGETFLDLPLWIMIILCVIFFWAVLGVLLLTLIMGYHFSFSGPQLGKVKRSAPQCEVTEDVTEPIAKDESAPSVMPEDNASASSADTPNNPEA